MHRPYNVWMSVLLARISRPDWVGKIVCMLLLDFFCSQQCSIVHDIDDIEIRNEECSTIKRLQPHSSFTSLDKDLFQASHGSSPPSVLERGTGRSDHSILVMALTKRSGKHKVDPKTVSDCMQDAGAVKTVV